MTSVSAPTIDNSAGGLKFSFLAHVQSLPVVTDSIDQLYSYPIGRNAGETLKTVSATAFKFSGPINPLLQKADSYADSGLKNIESRFPLVKAPTSEIKEQLHGTAKTTVDTYVGAFHDRFGGIVGKTKANGHAAADDLKSNAKDAKAKAEDKAPEAKAKADNTIQRVFNLSSSILDNSSNAAKTVFQHGVDTVAGVAGTATEYAQFAIQNPGKVPEAAISSAKAHSATVRDRVDETVEVTRKTAHNLTDLAQQAQGTAIEVFQSERKSAPKDQPRGIVITMLNTALVLTGKSLDHAKTYFQEHNSVPSKVDAAGDKISEAGDKVKEASRDAASKVDDALPEEVEFKKTANHVQDKATNSAITTSRSVGEILDEAHHN